MTTEIEKKSLEAHVELCAERYGALETKLGNLATKVEKLEEHIIFIRDKLSSAPNSANKTLITIGTTLVGALITGMIVILVNFINK
jgi:predicted nuclease with TOPRIM domain